MARQSFEYNRFITIIAISMVLAITALFSLSATGMFVAVDSVDCDSTFSDFDSDGLSDYDECNIYGSNPAIADSDNDGISDGIEAIEGTDLLNS